MKGYMVWAGKDRNNSMYDLFTCSEAAHAQLKSNKGCGHLKVAQHGLEEVEIEKCRLGHRYLAEDRECIKCTDLAYDARHDKYPEELEDDDEEP